MSHICQVFCYSKFVVSIRKALSKSMNCRTDLECSIQFFHLNTPKRQHIVINLITQVHYSISISNCFSEIHPTNQVLLQSFS